MCGICGQLNFDKSIVQADPLQRMSLSMNHRGPDDEGIYLNGIIGLAHRRLSVIDLSTAGHQPMPNHDHTIWIVYNGEIYNFKELRCELQQKGCRFRSDTDTEVILYLYEELGERCVEKLNGMFAFAIWDDREQKLIMARDRMGIKPLYYYSNAEFLIFASEVRALTAGGSVPRTLSHFGLQSYLMFGGVQSIFTTLENVYALLPAHILIAKDGLITTYPYWEIKTRGILRSLTEINEELSFLLEDSVRIRMVSDVPMGAFLSGGIDSGAIVSLMSQFPGNSLKTISLVFEDQEFDESLYSRKIAEIFNTEHHEIPITEKYLLSQVPEALKAMDQPTVDGVNTYFVSFAARQAGLTVALSGLGGDEIFGGYESFHVVPRMECYRHVCQFMPDFIKKSLALIYGRFAPENDRHIKIADFLAKGKTSLNHSYFLMRSFFTEEQLKKLLWQEINFWQEENFQKHIRLLLNKAEEMDAVNQVSFFETTTYMRDILLRDTDFMSMTHSLEVRVPFIDYRIVELMFSIPGNFKLKGPGPKHLLWQNLRKPLPDSVIYRSKQGFTFPFARWIRQGLYSEVKDVLLSPVDKISEFLNQKGVEQVWKEFERGKTSWHRVWILYVLKKWVESNI